MNRDIEKLEKTLGYTFNNKKLLIQALTHGSCTGDVTENYERLEFLGDRVLGLAVAEMLYDTFPKEPEGSLSQRHTSLVCKETVAELSRALTIDQYVHIASEDIRENDNVLCDVGEAVIGAIYVDGGSEKALEYVRAKWKDLLHKSHNPPKDSKTELQEMSHIKGLGMPTYEVVKREGSEHEPIFHIAVNLEGTTPEVGQGRDKKLAEQDAAHKMLMKIRNFPNHGK